MREPPEVDLSSHSSKSSAVRNQIVVRTDEVNDFMTDNLAVPEVSAEVGTHQRRQLRVPTCETPDGTVISVGRRQDSRNYDGYGLTTIAHVAISAEGGKAESTLTAQSNGQLLIQADDDSAYVVSKGPSVLASAAVANVTASGAVVIAAGGSIEVGNAAIEGQAPQAPAALSGHPVLMAAAQAGWELWDETVGDAVAARDTLCESADPDEKTEWGPTQEVVEAAELGLAAHVDRNQLGAADANDAGGVSIFGEAGFLLGSPAFGMVHAEEALTLSSKKPAIAATETLDLSSQGDAALTAGEDVVLVGSQKVRVIANDDDLLLATRKGEKAALWAESVHIGELEPPDPQTETGLVSLRAKARISLATDKDGGRDEGDDGIFMETHEVINGLADSTIELASGESVTLKIDGDTEYSVVVDSEGTITITSDQTKLSISDSDGLIFGDTSDYLTASSDTVFAGVDSNNCVEISSSEVAIKGSKIEIG